MRARRRTDGEGVCERERSGKLGRIHEVILLHLRIVSLLLLFIYRRYFRFGAVLRPEAGFGPCSSS